MRNWTVTILVCSSFATIATLSAFGIQHLVTQPVMAAVQPQATPKPPLVECELFAVNKGIETWRCIDPDFDNVCYDKIGGMWWCEKED